MAAAVTQTGAHAEAKAGGRPFGWYGMVFFLASEAFFFANLIAAYLYLRVEHGASYLEKEKLNIPLAAVNTVILVSSSFVLTWALGGLKRGNNRRLAIGIGLTLLLGLTFLGVQAYEYMALVSEGLTPSVEHLRLGVLHAHWLPLRPRQLRRAAAARVSLPLDARPLHRRTSLRPDGDGDVLALRRRRLGDPVPDIVYYCVG